MQRARVTQLTPKKGRTCQRTSPDNLEKLEDKKGAWNPGRRYAARGGRGAGNLHRRGGREGPRTDAGEDPADAPGRGAFGRARGRGRAQALEGAQVERPRPTRPTPEGPARKGPGDDLQKPARAARIARECLRAVPGSPDLQRELGRVEGRLEITETAESTLRADLERE